MEKAKHVQHKSPTFRVKLNSLEGKIIFSELTEQRFGMNRIFKIKDRKGLILVEGEHSNISVGKRIKIYWDNAQHGTNPLEIEAYELLNSLRAASRYCSKNYEFVDK